MRIVFILIFLVCYLFCSPQVRRNFEIYFNSGNAVMSESSKNKLDSLFNKIHSDKISSINIYGYCDSIGNAEYNNKLSINRAKTVKKYIETKGIIADSIFIKGFGKTVQKYKSDKWDKNRRVSIEICYKKKIVVNKEIAKNNIKTIIIQSDSVEINKSKKTDENVSISEFAKNAEIGDNIVLKNITFYGGKAKPMPESYKTLKELVKTLNENPKLEICIEGHICCDSFDNDDLSGRRAFAVYSYLVDNGINKYRLTYKGFGHTKPLTLENSEEEMQMNRRVEIRVVNK